MSLMACASAAEKRSTSPRSKPRAASDNGANSGKPASDSEAGFEALKKMSDLQPIWAKDTDSIMNAFRDEEALVGLLYKSQTYTVKGWNTPVDWAYPKEGGIPYVAGTCIAKNTKNFELAEQYLDVTMDRRETVVEVFGRAIKRYPRRPSPEGGATEFGDMTPGSGVDADD